MKRIRGASISWMNSDILSLIAKRDKIKEDFDKTRCLQKLIEYKKFRNFVKNRVDSTKRNLYVTKFDNYSDSGKMWKLFDDLIGRKKKCSNLIELKINGNLVSSDEVKCDILKEAFVVDDVLNLDERSNFVNSLKLSDNISPVTTEEVRSCFRKLKKKTASKSELPVKVLFDFQKYLLLPLSILFSNIMATGQIPNRFKEALVTPLYKGKGSVHDASSFRLISNLPILSKLFELILKSRVMVAVENSGLLDDNQHGFRRGISCITAHTVLSNTVHNMLDAPNAKVFMVFVDLRKAFDSVRHLLLLEMLRDYYNIDHNLVFVIFNYLTNRRFYIKLGSFISKAYDLLRGLPQGSINGPSFYVLFFNDICTV
jgi:hypothetical protein